MNDEDLKRLWREQPLALPPALAGTHSIEALRKKMSQFDRTIWWRDLRELAAGLFVIAIFGPFFFVYPQPLAKLGCVMVVLSALFIDWRLLSSKRRAGRQQPGTSVMDSLQVELRKVENQIQLLCSVWYWYLLPLLGSVEVFYFGIEPGAAERGISVVFSLLFGWFLHWLNQRAVRSYLVPLKNDLASLLNMSLELGPKL